MTWQKGQSGNPGGMTRMHKKFREVAALIIQEKTGGPSLNWYVRKLLDFIEYGESHKIKLWALELLMSYHLGKPHGSFDLDADSDAPMVIITGVPEPIVIIDDPKPPSNGTNDS